MAEASKPSKTDELRSTHLSSILADLLVVAGIAAVVAGCGMVHRALGLIVLGLALVMIGTRGMTR